MLLDPRASAIDAQKIELRQAKDAASAEEQGRAIARLVALAAGVAPETVMLDRDQQRVQAQAAPLPGAELSTYWAIEQRAQDAAHGWDVTIVPPLAPMPVIRFADGSDTLDGPARTAVLASIWAARRWNIHTLAIPSLPRSPAEHPLLPQRRATAIATLVRERGLAAAPASTEGPPFRLAASPASPMP